MAGKPSSKLDRLQRITVIQGWLADGKTTREILQLAADRWDLAQRTAYDAINAARRQMFEQFTIDRPDFLAQQLERLEVLANKSIEQNQPSAALGCFKEMHALLGLYAGGSGRLP